MVSCREVRMVARLCGWSWLSHVCSARRECVLRSTEHSL